MELDSGIVVEEVLRRNLRISDVVGIDPEILDIILSVGQVSVGGSGTVISHLNDYWEFDILRSFLFHLIRREHDLVEALGTTLGDIRR